MKKASIVALRLMQSGYNPYNSVFTLLGGNDGLAIDFLQQSLLIKDSGTPANNYLGLPSGKLTVTSPIKYVCRNGVLVQTTVNSLPYDYDPITNAANGVLLEPSRTNLLIRSQDFATGWGSNGSPNGVTVSSAVAVAPDGTTTADLLIPEAAAGVHDRFQSFGSAGISLHYTFSVYLKKQSYQWVFIYLGNLGFNSELNGAYFDLQNGVVGNTSGSLYVAGSAKIVALSNGWYRCTITATSDIDGGTGVAGIIPSSANGNTISTGDGTTGLYAWGAQVEQADTNSSYIFTAASQNTRSADSVTLATSLIPWNGTDMTAMAEARQPRIVAGLGSMQINISDGSTLNRHTIGILNTNGKPLGYTAVAGVTQAGITGAGWNTTEDVIKRIVYGAQANNFNAASENILATATLTGTMPTCTTIRFGGIGTGSFFQPQWLRKILLLGTQRLTDPQLQALSVVS